MTDFKKGNDTLALDAALIAEVQAVPEVAAVPVSGLPAFADVATLGTPLDERTGEPLSTAPAPAPLGIVALDERTGEPLTGGDLGPADLTAPYSFLLDAQPGAVVELTLTPGVIRAATLLSVRDGGKAANLRVELDPFRGDLMAVPEAGYTVTPGLLPPELASQALVLGHTLYLPDVAYDPARAAGTWAHLYEGIGEALPLAEVQE